MFLDQKIGPFSQNEIIFNKNNVKYLKIGVEYSNSIPFLERIKNNYWEEKLFINDKEFIVSEKDILELQINHEQIKIRIQNNTNPYVILNISYEIAN